MSLILWSSACSPRSGRESVAQGGAKRKPWVPSENGCLQKKKREPAKRAKGSLRQTKPIGRKEMSTSFARSAGSLHSSFPFPRADALGYTLTARSAGLDLPVSRFA